MNLIETFVRDARLGHVTTVFAFTIFEELINVVAREAVRLRKNIRPSLMYMQEASVRGYFGRFSTRTLIAALCQDLGNQRSYRNKG